MRSVCSSPSGPAAGIGITAAGPGGVFATVGLFLATRFLVVLASLVWLRSARVGGDALGEHLLT